MVIVGKAISSKPQLDAEEIQASINLKVISVARGTLIAARSEFATAQLELSAFDLATAKISDFLIDSVRQFLEPQKRVFSKKNQAGSPSKKSSPKPLPQAPISDIPSMFGDL